MAHPSSGGAASYEYSGFGFNSGGMIGDRFRYTSRELDQTGLQYHRARYYDPTIGRWTQQDPIGFSSGDVNLYRYVGNSPTNCVAPWGLKPLICEVEEETPEGGEWLTACFLARV